MEINQTGLDLEMIKEAVRNIYVINFPNEDVEVINRSPLQMIGKGRQGAVFLVSDQAVMKVYGDPDDCEREYYAMSLGQHTNLLPKIYAKGPNYIVMEFVGGVDLREYLQSQPLTRELAEKLIDMLITFKKIGFERIDHHKRQIYLQTDGSLKVIDVGRTVWRDRVYPYPRKLLNSLGKDHKDTFLSYVQTLAPELYAEWKYFIEMEELSKELTNLLLAKGPSKKDYKKYTKILLAETKDNKEGKPLEDLVYKVFKEEWVKVMLAQGKDPDYIMDLIKQERRDYMEGLEDSNLPEKYKKKEKKKKKVKKKGVKEAYEYPSTKFRYAKKRKKRK